MESFDRFWALGSGVLGVALLHASWRGRLGPKWFVVASGWILLGGSTLFFIRWAGGEFGAAYVTLWAAVVAWLLVLLSLERRRPEERRRRVRGSGFSPTARGVLSELPRLLVALPVAGVASAYASVACVKLLPWSDANRLALGVFLMPAIWGSAAIWAAADSRPLRPALALTAIGAFSWVVLFPLR